MRIKFLDTGEELEVTRASQLAKTKVRVTPETSRQIQEAAILLGFRWADGESEVQDIDQPFLVLADPCMGSHCIQYVQEHDLDYFVTHPAREFVFLPSQPQQIQRGETGQRGEITPEALEAEGWAFTPSQFGRFPYFRKGEIKVVIGNIMPVVHVGNVMTLCSTMPDLRTLDRLVNGVGIPSKTNTNN